VVVVVTHVLVSSSLESFSFFGGYVSFVTTLDLLMTMVLDPALKTTFLIFRLMNVTWIGTILNPTKVCIGFQENVFKTIGQ
jgi:hypothetical protein